MREPAGDPSRDSETGERQDPSRRSALYQALLRHQQRDIAARQGTIGEAGPDSFAGSVARDQGRSDAAFDLDPGVRERYRQLVGIGY